MPTAGYFVALQLVGGGGGGGGAGAVAAVGYAWPPSESEYGR